MALAKEAFFWIINILRKHNVPFQISGGLAARAYGSKRPLWDIDIEMDDAFFEKIVPDVKNYIVFGPRYNVTETFKVQLLRLDYKGQMLDLSGSNEQMFDKNKGEWVVYPIDFSKVVDIEIFGLTVPVLPKKALIDYKRTVLRDVDKIDLEQISD